MSKDMQHAKKEWLEALENLRTKAAKNPSEYTAIAKAFEDVGEMVFRFFDRDKMTGRPIGL